MYFLKKAFGAYVSPYQTLKKDHYQHVVENWHQKIEGFHFLNE